MKRDPKSLRIVFMGTPGFAVGPLEMLVKEGYTVAGVVTVPDKPAGRGKQLNESDVKKFALANGLKILQPEKLKAPEFIEELKALQPDLQVVVAFRMLPEIVWSLPPLGTFNLHASLLPAYRGAAPINRAIMNGETKTGVTTFFLQQEIDTGSIVFREELSIGENETAGELHDRLMIAGTALVKKTIDAIAEGDCPRIPQSSLVKTGETLPEAPKIFRDDCRISWSSDAKKVHDHIRGLSPFPTAWTILKKENGEEIPLKIFRSEYFSGGTQQQPGEIRNGLEVACGKGFVRVLELQAPGRKKLPAQEFLRGFPLGNNDRMI
ncbi:MAG TPA: methionyl-tRNA formyltransferase [Bacteroidia bacterium]|nr:methionyl-tRNA formyltransferase [Bacteroidia bacterium]